jgi:hypothetical protein
MSGPKRNPDKLNTIGVVVVGICGAVLVYVSIVALQAFYMNDTSELQHIADYGGTDTQSRSLRTEQVNNITEVGKNAVAAPKAGEQPKPATFRMNIDDAMRAVVESAKVDPSTLVPAQGRSDKSTIQPIPGRPVPMPTPVAPLDGAGAGSGSGSGAGSAATSEPSAPMTPTGGQGQGGSAPAGGNPGTSGTAVPPPPISLPNTTGTGGATPVGAGSGSAVPKPASSVNPTPAPKGNAP